METQQPIISKDKKEIIFDPEKIDCRIETDGYILENPPKELMDKLTGKSLSECENIIANYLKPKEKIVIKWYPKIGFKTANDNR